MNKSKYKSAKNLLNVVFYLAIIGIFVSIWLTNWTVATKLSITSIMVIFLSFVLYWGVKQEEEKAEGKK